MSKKSFNDIEQIIKNAAEVYQPAFEEESWKKMEAMLDKEKDRKRPFIFWIWWLLPVLIGAGVIGFYSLNKNADRNGVALQEDHTPGAEKNSAQIAESNIITDSPKAPDSKNKQVSVTDHVQDRNEPAAELMKKSLVSVKEKNRQNKKEPLFSKNKLSDKVNGKLNARITTAGPVYEEANDEKLSDSNVPELTQNKSNAAVEKEEVIIVKVDAYKAGEKEVEKIIDSVMAVNSSDKRTKNKQYRFYIIAAAGPEVSGVKLFSSDKTTGKAGLALGYQINKKLSVQAGFFVSNKKYVATGSDYKTKPGTYWSTVDIKKITANCRVYEIPVSVRYDFTAGKKLHIFASAGLSSYIMKKEDYRLYYDRYGSPHQAEIYYSGNKNLFTVLRLSAGVEKKISNQVAVFASPGIAIPLTGVGEGEVKLYSTDMIIGLKINLFKK